MGARIIRQRGFSKARRKEESRAIAMIVCAIVLSLILAFILVAADMRSDLSELIPGEAPAEPGISLIGWADLEIPQGRTVSLEQKRWQPQRRVRMLGYMMEGYLPDRYKPSPDGASVAMFVLGPEAGQLLHPAHRNPDQMVEIWPLRPASFNFRSLVWATGNLTRKAMTRDTGKPFYSMTGAEVKPAVQSDITLWFKP